MSAPTKGFCPMCGQEISIEIRTVKSVTWQEQSGSFAFEGSFICPQCGKQHSIKWGDIPASLIEELDCPVCHSRELQLSNMKTKFNQTDKGSEVTVEAEVRCKKCTSTMKKVGRELASKLGKVTSVSIAGSSVEFNP